MNLAGKRFLVVGGAGFIGSHVVDELLRRPVAEVVIYDSFVRGTMANLENAKQDSRVTIVSDKPQVSDFDRLVKATTGIDGVFNLAAIGILACNELPDKAIEVNIEGNWNVFLAASKCGVEKIVHSSSASVYGDAQRIPMDEDHPYNNRTLYGATKIATEHMLPVCADMSGLKWQALRYFNVYGPRQDYKGAYISVLHRILDRLYASQPPILFGDGSQTLDFVHVSDVARANVLAMESEAPCGFYNVCSGKGTTLGEVTNLLMDLTAIYLDPEYRNVNIGTSLVSKRIGDPSKAFNGFGFSASVSLAEGMQSLINWRKFNESQLRSLQTCDETSSVVSAATSVS